VTPRRLDYRPMRAGSRVGAAIDVGSNSVHMLVARPGAAGLVYLRDESILLGLGDVVDRHGAATPEVAGALVQALSEFVATARGLGAADVTLLGTEPLRRAANADDVTQRVAREVGLPLHVLSERHEGQLTYVGVTAGQPSAGSLLVVDIGGGSTEVVVAQPEQPLEVFSLASGSARLSRGIVEHDPPTVAEKAGLAAAAHRLVEELPPRHVMRAVFVGGTGTNLARLAPVGRAGLEVAHHWLGILPAAEISARFGVNLRRARQLPAGAAIVGALLARFGVDEGTVSDASLRDGAIIAAALLGPTWLDRLDELVDATLAGDGTDAKADPA
jgi:exopolyphosphatase/pppGpp-phosphohydrolase